MVEIYVEARLADETAADAIWHLWDQGLISDDWMTGWLLVAVSRPWLRSILSDVSVAYR